MLDETSILTPMRDLIDFKGGALYFETPPETDVAGLLDQAANAESPIDRAHALKRAETLSPDDLNVIVALYRHHYFEQEFEQAIVVADRAIVQAARKLNVSTDWRLLAPIDISNTGDEAMPLLRFYLWALKGRAYLQMRLALFEDAIGPLEKLVELDHANRLNCQPLLDLAREQLQQKGETNEK